MGLFRTIKRNARHALAGAWGRAIGVMLLAMLPAGIINALETGLRRISGVSSFYDYAGTPGSVLDDRANMMVISIIISVMITLLLFVVTTPLRQGLTRWFYRRTGGKNEGVTELFWYFESAKGYGKSLWLHFQIGLRTLLWSLLICIPFGLCEVVLLLLQQRLDSVSSPVYTIWMLLTLAVGMLTGIFILLVSLRYFLAPYLLAEYPDIKVRQAVRDSVKMMHGHKGSVFLFELSFILWFLPMVLCLLMCFPMMFAPGIFIGMAPVMLLLLIVQLGLCFYLLPYLYASYGLYARFLIQKAAGGMEPFLREEEDTSTREYEAYKPEIDRYMDEQRAAQQLEAETEPPAPDGKPEEQTKEEF